MWIKSGSPKYRKGIIAIPKSMKSAEQLRTTIAVSDKPFSIGELYDFHKNGRLTFDTEYQRSEVWRLKKKQRLIDSILRKYDISKIFLRHRLDGVFECLDGQQRLRSIFQYIDNTYPTSPEMTKELDLQLYYNKNHSLPDFLRNRIREFVITATLVHNIDEETTSDIFLRLQEGMPLNSAEKLNAISGFMRKRVIELSRHPFFNHLGVANTRFAHRYLISQILTLELAKDLIDLKYRNLEKYYRQYKDRDVNKLYINHVKQVLNLLNSSLGKDKSAIRFKTDVISIYLLASEIVRNYSITGIKDRLHDFILDFLIKASKSSDYGIIGASQLSPYDQYAVTRSTSIDTKGALEDIRKIVLSKFLEFFPNIQLKASSRIFNYHQKLAIYYRDKGICQSCKKQIPFDQGEADHKIRYADGGPTTVENGRWLCIHCNRSLSR